MGTATTFQTKEIAVMSVRIEREQLQRLGEIAAKNRRSVAQEIRWLIDQRINEAPPETTVAS